MAILPVRLIGDPVLRKKSESVKEVDDIIKKLVSDMKDTLKDIKGLGLSAVQVGKLLRLFITDFSSITKKENDICVFINPEILETDGISETEEGCLSIPGLYCIVKRPYKIKLKWTDINNKEHIGIFENLKARVILHELDHLDGILFVDKISLIKKYKIKSEILKISKYFDEAKKIPYWKKIPQFQYK